jgi:hypothetical protein
VNALDKAIGYFSPERAFRRAQFRRATQAFAYDGAKSGRRTDGWIAAGGDANTEVGASLINLPQRYFLSAVACAGILRRAAKQQTPLLPILREVLMRLAAA